MSPLGLLRRELPGILPLFGPILVSQYAGIANGVVDTAMAARLGTVDLGSVAVGVALCVPLNMFTLGVLYGTLMLLSRLHGAGDYEGVRKTAHQGLWLGFALGACAALAGWFISYRIGWFGASPDLVGLSGEYLRMLLPGFFCLSLAIAMRFFCEGQKVIVPITVMSVIMVLLNVFFNYCLMFGNFGMPAMGVRGCGLATSLSQAGFLLMVAFYIRFGPGSPGRDFFQRFYAPDKDVLRQIFKIGVPIGLGITLEYLVFTLITLFIASVGAVAAAAHQVCFSSMMLLFGTPLALSVAASIRVGNLLGSGDTEALHAAIKGIAILSALIGLAFACLMAFGSSMIAGVFTNDPKVIALASSVLVIAAFFQLSDSIQANLNGMLRGAGDTAVPFFMTTATYWTICLPLGYVLSGMPLPGGLGLSPELFGIRGWWMALTVSITLAAVLLALRVKKTFWKALPEQVQEPMAEAVVDA